MYTYIDVICCTYQNVIYVYIYIHIYIYIYTCIYIYIYIYMYIHIGVIYSTYLHVIDSLICHVV